MQLSSNHVHRCKNAAVGLVLAPIPRPAPRPGIFSPRLAAPSPFRPGGVGLCREARAGLTARYSSRKCMATKLEGGATMLHVTDCQ